MAEPFAWMRPGLRTAHTNRQCTYLLKTAPANRRTTDDVDGIIEVSQDEVTKFGFVSCKTCMETEHMSKRDRVITDLVVWVSGTEDEVNPTTVDAFLEVRGFVLKAMTRSAREASPLWTKGCRPDQK